LSLGEERDLFFLPLRLWGDIAAHRQHWEDGVAAYRIRFMKKLNTGREHSGELCVWSINIRTARDAIRAVSAAKRRFERFAGVANWRLQADRIRVDARPLSGEKAQDGGQWPSYLKSRMVMMQKNVAVGAQE
jgi:hypothetical protein